MPPDAGQYWSAFLAHCFKEKARLRHTAWTRERLEVLGWMRTDTVQRRALKTTWMASHGLAAEWNVGQCNICLVKPQVSFGPIRCFASHLPLT
jgi:hypothetical protein